MTKQNSLNKDRTTLYTPKNLYKDGIDLLKTAE